MRLFNLLRILNPPWVANRLYVIGGELYPQYRATYKEPNYSTDPKYYQLKLNSISDKGFENICKDTIKAFTRQRDAIEFGRHCDLQDVFCLVYDRIFGKWVSNPEAAGKIVDEIR